MDSRKRIHIPDDLPTIPAPMVKQLCSRCKGAGDIMVQQGDMQLRMYCPACRGEGAI